MSKRIDRDGGVRLKEIGVSVQKFNSQSLPEVSEFEAISSEKACSLIWAVRNTDVENIDEAFDIVLNLYRKNEDGFERLCDEPDLVQTHGLDMLYEIEDNKAITTNSQWSYDCDEHDYEPDGVVQPYYGNYEDDYYSTQLTGRYVHLPQNDTSEDSY